MTIYYRSNLIFVSVILYDLSLLDGGRKSHPADVDRRLHIYCYPGTAKRDLWRIWTSYTVCT